MNDAGYVLADTLAALAIVGLTMGGVLAGSALLARVQATTETELTRDGALKRASVALNDLLGQAGPFRSRDVDFSGRPDGFDFACGEKRCSVRLKNENSVLELHVNRASGHSDVIELRGWTNARFDYTGAYDTGETWPRSSARPDRLRQVRLTDAATTATLAQARLPIDQPIQCEFDVVSQDCR